MGQPVFNLYPQQLFVINRIFVLPLICAITDTVADG